MTRETHKIRTVIGVFKPDKVSDGAGVKIKRVIASSKLDHFDPFLLLDEFKSEKADDYIAGFPMHPHRGIETVTYMLSGQIKHEDSLGNAGIIGPGDIQWMTAGRGIIHSEMPEQKDGLMWGFQLWVNLPSSDKMTEPRYQDIKRDNIPTVFLSSGVTVRVIAGKFEGIRGPISEIAASPHYLDVKVPKNSQFMHDLASDHAAVVYVFEGSAKFPRPDGSKLTVGPSELAVLSTGDYLKLESGHEGARFILLAGRPFKEPIVRHGPFAMNTWEEIATAFSDYNQGRFV